MMEPGVRPIMRLASAPTASTRLSLLSMATTEGSLITIPWPRTATSVLAVPRSMARSPPYSPKRVSKSDMVPALFAGSYSLAVVPPAEAYSGVTETTFQLMPSRRSSTV